MHKSYIMSYLRLWVTAMCSQPHKLDHMMTRGLEKMLMREVRVALCGLGPPFVCLPKLAARWDAHSALQVWQFAKIYT